MKISPSQSFGMSQALHPVQYHQLWVSFSLLHISDLLRERVLCSIVSTWEPPSGRGMRHVFFFYAILQMQFEREFALQNELPGRQMTKLVFHFFQTNLAPVRRIPNKGFLGQGGTRP